jgi:hypothetical protein
MNIMDMEELKNSYKNYGTYRNTKSIVKKVNEILGFSDTILRPQKYIDNFELIVKEYAKTKMNPSVKNVTSKLSTISGTLKKINSPQHDEFQNLVKNLILDEGNEIQHHARPWNEILDLIEKQYYDGDFNKKKTLICYKHQYCLRVGEIFQTILEDDGVHNFMDLEKGLWTIRLHKNQLKTGNRIIKLTPEFIKEIKPYITESKWLICKNNGQPYSTHNHKAIGIIGLSNNEIRNSYEQWNHEESNRNFVTKQQHSLTLGHTVDTAVKHYSKNTKAKKIKIEIKKKDPIDPDIELRKRLWEHEYQLARKKLEILEKSCYKNGDPHVFDKKQIICTKCGMANIW